jgi:hypothetical protein
LERNKTTDVRTSTLMAWLSLVRRKIVRQLPLVTGVNITRKLMSMRKAIPTQTRQKCRIFEPSEIKVFHTKMPF